MRSINLVCVALNLKLVCDFLITLLVFAFEVTEQAAAVADHFQQTPAGMIVLAVDLKVFADLFDFLGQDGDLDFWRASVVLVGLELLDDRVFLFFGKHILGLSSRQGQYIPLRGLI